MFYYVMAFYFFFFFKGFHIAIQTKKKLKIEKFQKDDRVKLAPACPPNALPPCLLAYTGSKGSGWESVKAFCRFLNRRLRPFYKIQPKTSKRGGEGGLWDF